MSKEVAVHQENTDQIEAFGTGAAFEHAQRVAKMLSTSTLIPKEFQGNIQNTMIALEMAYRIGASPLMVMQNLYIVHGKPSWSSSFIIAAINACKKFSPLRFEIVGEGEASKCRAWAYDVETKDRLDGPWVSMQMAKDEGWVSKSGSKWKTMPELMMRYRSAAFFGRLYAPEILMGMHTREEVKDAEVIEEMPTTEQKETERVVFMLNDATTVEELEELEPIAAQFGQTDLFNQRKEQILSI